MSYQGPGVYRHWKGNRYHVIGLALQEDTVTKPPEPSSDNFQALIDEADRPAERTYVIYRPLDLGSLLEDREEGFWAREIRDFNAMVEVGDLSPTRMARFELLHSNPVAVLDRDLSTDAERRAYRSGVADTISLITYT